MVLELASYDYSEQSPIDSIMLIAEQSGERSVVCLYPETALQPAIEVQGTGAHVCSDVSPLEAINNTMSSHDSWQFSERAVNFELDSSASVEVTAVGRLGARKLFEADPVSVEPATDYPEVPMALKSTSEVEELFAGDSTSACTSRLSSITLPTFTCDLPTLDNSNHCPFEPNPLVGVPKALSWSNQTGCHVRNERESVTCNNEFHGRYVYPLSPVRREESSDPFPLVVLRVRAARCSDPDLTPADRDCELTADCTMLDTRIVPLEAEPLMMGGAIEDPALYGAEPPGVNLSCLPPSAVPYELAQAVQIAVGNYRTFLYQQPVEEADVEPPPCHVTFQILEFID